MITALTISGFKCFKRCTVELASLSVLAGLNGAGKTTIIQALLLARQSFRSAEVVALNGPFGMELGTVQDVLNDETPGDLISLLLHSDEYPERETIDFVASNPELLHLPITRRPSISPLAVGGPERFFTYLCAERWGPRNVLPSSPSSLQDLNVGVHGEFSAHILALHDVAEKIPNGRLHPQYTREVDCFLKYQVEAWLSDMVRPIEIEATSYLGTIVTGLRYRSPGGEWVRAPNMGFGISFCLPIVLAGLFSPEGSVLLVENPEAHLHPAGQSRMGYFLATLANSGLQVIVETHSDHILNGIRRAIGDGRLAADKAIVDFIDDENKVERSVHALRFSRTGTLDRWPPKFFDQYQIDVAALAKMRIPPS